MSWLKWPFQIFLALIVITSVAIIGWEQIVRSDYRSFKGSLRAEQQLKREFQGKSKQANNLSGYRKQAIELAEKLTVKRELMLRFSDPKNVEAWCLQLSIVSGTKIKCERTKKIENTFYYEQQVDINLLLQNDTLSSFLQTLTSNNTINLDTVFWQNIIIQRNKQTGYLDLKATLSFVYWREESDS